MNGYWFTLAALVIVLGFIGTKMLLIDIYKISAG